MVKYPSQRAIIIPVGHALKTSSLHHGELKMLKDERRRVVFVLKSGNWFKFQSHWVILKNFAGISLLTQNRSYIFSGDMPSSFQHFKNNPDIRVARGTFKFLRSSLLPPSNWMRLIKAVISV